MSVLNQSGEEQVECPLCMEPLEVDDLNFFPCTCGYQICRFCWHRIRTDENGLCPACRKAYPENPADFKPLSQEEVARLKAEKRHKDQQRKQKITENRKHLANVRVVQRNLVFVVGLPMRLADAEVLKKHEYFGKFGKIHKVVINQSTSYAGSQGPSASAYVTYQKADDALRAIQAVNNISVDGRTIKTSLGTTKYCSHFMKNQPCPKPDCMYLHDLGDAEASFTKEEMQQGKHQEYEKKLHEQLLNTYNHSSTSRDRKPTPSPPAVASGVSSCQNVYQGSSTNTSCSGTNSGLSSTSCIQGTQSCNKEAWPLLQPGLITNSNSSGTNFGLSSGGNGNTNNSNNNNGSKGESSQRRQRFDQQSAKVTNNIHKNRHTSGEENRGKAKEKLQSSLQDEVGCKSVHMKSQHSNSRSLSSHDLHQNLQHSARSSNNSSSSSSSEVMNGPTMEADSDLQESDDNLVNIGNSCTTLGTNRRQQLGSRILPANHRTALFEPDNNSFFSTNNFTKVAATSTVPATADWPINGLTLTHMPDVLPSVHSSEDWQAAFGFSNSTNPPDSQHQENNCLVITSDNQHIQSVSSGPNSKVESRNVDNDFDSSDQRQSQSFKNNVEDKSLVESVITQFSPPASNLNEDFGVNTSSSGHLPQKIDTVSDFGPEEENLGNTPLPTLQNSVAPALTSNCVDGTQQTFTHSPSFVHQDATVLMMHHHQLPVNNLVNHIAGSQHVVTNVLPPSQATSKFLADFHLRHQQSQNLMKQLNSQSQPHSHLHNHSPILGGNFVGRNRSNLTNITPAGGKFSILGSSDINTLTGDGSGECKVNSENKLQNGGDTVDADLGISDEEKYVPSFLNHQQKDIEQSIEFEYKNGDGNSDNCITATMENSEETSTKDNSRLTDDELGFDPFHETQKALAEMMEKENTMLMMQDQQNKQQPPHGFLSQAHLHNQHNTLSHLTHHLYQQYQLNQMNHFNHQVPHASGFGGSKLLGSFTTHSQQHILPQQNHRLPPNVSGCAKLLDGLGLGPSNVTPVGPSAPTRTRLPPPGFTTAPNHMNAFGLGIPRAPSNNSSKILPFMGLGNNSSNNGSSSPIPQTMSNLPNNIAHSSSLHPQHGTNQQSVLFPSNGNHSATNNHTFGLQNGIVSTGVCKTASESFTVKEWPENLRSLLPNLNGGSHNQGVQFAGDTPTPPPVFGAPHTPMQGNTQNGWSGVGPCTDWTALDPAIVSSSRPHNFLAATSSTNHHSPLNPSTNPGLHLLHNTNSILLQNKPPVEQQNTGMSSANPPSTPIAMPHLHQLQQNNIGHWLRSLSSEESGCVFYSSNVLGGSSAEWAASSNHLGNGNGRQQPNCVFYGSNVLGGGSADWATNSNHSSSANGQQQQNHVVGSPNSGSVMMAAPPPGFSSMRLAAMQQGAATANSVHKKQSSMVNTEIGKIEITDISQSESGILQSKEEDRIEDLR